MALLAPPPRPPRPPRVAFGDNDGLRWVRLRLWQIEAAAITVFLTAWCCTLGPIPAVVALMIAKEVLVAILVMGLGVAAPVVAFEPADGWPSHKIVSPTFDWR